MKKDISESLKKLCVPLRSLSAPLCIKKYIFPMLTDLILLANCINCGVADWKYEKTTQIPDFFVKTLIIGDEVQSEVRDMSEIILLFSNA
jgi:hypothetical protein